MNFAIGWQGNYMGLAAKHLSESRRREIAQGLFTVTSVEEAKGEIHGLCPVHGPEKNPSFSYNYKKDVYHCLACGADGDLMRLWSEVKGYGQKEGFKTFCAEFGVELDTKTGTARKETESGAEVVLDPEVVRKSMLSAWEKFPPLPESFQDRLVKSRGWSREIMAEMDLRLQTHAMDRKTGNLYAVKAASRIAIPIHDASGALVNIRLYSPGAKQWKILSWAQSTGEARLFPATPKQDGLVLLCEGESDTLCALSRGYNAITQTSKLKNWPTEHLSPFSGRDVVVCYDADQPGQKYAKFAAQALAGTAKTIRTLRWPAFMGVDESGGVPKDHGQDLTDFFTTHKKAKEDLDAMIAAAGLYTGAVHKTDPGDSDLPPDPSEFFVRGENDRISFKPRLLANRLIQDVKLLSDPETGLLYRWNGQFWEQYDEDHVRQAALRYLGDEAQRTRVEDATFQARILSCIPFDRRVNDREGWICLKNGMFSPSTYEMTPHDPDFYCTYSLPVGFDPESNRTCDTWLRYLETSVVTPEAIAQLQEFAGYVLTRHTKYTKCLLLIGPGADGKSVYLRVLKELVGAENCAAVAFADLEDQFQRSALYGKFLNISTEVGAKAIDSPFFKAITAGDPLSAAFKHKNSFTFDPFCKMAFAANRLPRVLDNSDGFFRRVLPIQFKKQFLEGDPMRDTDLFDKLKGEMSEIFAWAVAGLARLEKNKQFTNCEETRGLMMDYRRDNNPVLCYVEDRCVLGENEETTKADLYDDYKSYCGKNGYSQMNASNFYRELYVAVHNLKQFRPRTGGIAERSIKGIRVNYVAQPEQ